MNAVGLGPALLAEILRHAAEGYPEEVCGLVLGRRGAPDSYVVRRLANLAGAVGPAGPDGWPRDARRAFWADPRDLIRADEEAAARGWQYILLYHSHPDTGAYFSEMDRQWALTPDGRPVWEGMAYLVVSLRGGRPAEAGLYTWDALARDFREERVALPEG